MKQVRIPIMGYNGKVERCFDLVIDLDEHNMWLEVKKPKYPPLVVMIPEIINQVFEFFASN